MEGKTLKEFLNNECQIFDFSLPDLSMYLIIFNINNPSVIKMIEYLNEEEMNLKITKEEDNDYTFLLHNLTNVQDLDFSENSEDYGLKIQKLCSQFLTNNAYLVSIGEKFLIIFDWNVMQDLIQKEKDTKILAVFLNNKEKFLDILKENSDLTLINFKKEDVENVSQLFEDEELKESKDNFAEDIPEDEAENFDKEFEYEGSEELEEEEIKSKNKKNKKHKRKKSDEYEGELDSKNYMEGKAKRRRREEVDESKFLNDVTVFLAKLREAIEFDKKNFILKKPAIEKLKLVPEMQKFLANNYCQKLFLQSGGLELLQDWIKKGRDNTYPVFNQITQMLDIISNLSISLSNLKSCQIGGYVMNLSKNKNLPHQIQKKAREIVEKWSRIIWDINTNYSNIESENIMYEMTFKNKRRRTSDEEFDSTFRNPKEIFEGEKIEENNKEGESLVKKEVSNLDIYSHAKIPKKGLFDFTKKPVSNLNISRDENIKMKINYFETKSGGRKKNE